MAGLVRFLKRRARLLALAAFALAMFAAWLGLFVRTLTPRPVATFQLPVGDEFRISGPDPRLLGFSRTGQTLVTCFQHCVGLDRWHAYGPLQVWDIPTGRLRHSLFAPRDNLYDALISQDGRFVILPQHDRFPATLFNTITGESLTLESLADPQQPKVLSTIAYRFTPDSRFLACTCNMWTDTSWCGLVLWDLDKRKEVTRLRYEHDPPAFSPDSRLLATFRNRLIGQTSEEVVVLRDTATGDEVATFPVHFFWRGSTDFSLDGTRLLANGTPWKDASWPADCFELVVWDLDTRQKLATVQVPRDGEALDAEMKKWKGMPPAKSLHPYTEQPLSRWHIVEQSRKRADMPVWTWVEAKLTGHPCEQSPDVNEFEFRDLLSGDVVARLEHDGPVLLLTGDEARVAIVKKNCVEIWDLPPRRPVGVLLALAAVPSLLFTLLLWWRFGR